MAAWPLYIGRRRSKLTHDIHTSAIVIRLHQTERKAFPFSGGDNESLGLVRWTLSADYTALTALSLKQISPDPIEIAPPIVPRSRVERHRKHSRVPQSHVCRSNTRTRAARRSMGASRSNRPGMPQITREEFERLPLRVHAFLAGVPLHDVWAVDLPRTRGGITLAEFLRRAGDLLRRPPSAVRAPAVGALFRGRFVRLGPGHTRLRLRKLRAAPYR
jgi:hypothetical protein